MESTIHKPDFNHIELVIFDCDGVLIDSEILCKRVLISMLADLGVVITGEYFDKHFLGKSFPSAKQQIVTDFNVFLADDFRDEYLAALLVVFAEELKPTDGLEQVLNSLNVKRCIATSSSPSRVSFSLETTGLSALFEGTITTSEEVENGKPAPDIFLLAAEKMGVLPEKCLVIEDSMAGIEGALAANMQVIRYMGASHLAKTACDQGHDFRVISQWKDFPLLAPQLFEK